MTPISDTFSVDINATLDRCRMVLQFLLQVHNLAFKSLEIFITIRIFVLMDAET